MSVQTNLKLPHFVKALLDVIYGLLFFSCIALVLLIVLSPLILKGANIPLTASVLVGIETVEHRQIDTQITSAAVKDIQNAYVDQAQGILRLETFNWYYVFISYFGKLLIALGLTYIFYLLRAVLKDILQEDPFSSENIVRIRWLGTMVLIMGFVSPTVEYIAANEILRELQVQTPLILPTPFKVEFILFSLLILLLAQVLSVGLELKRDQELTI